MKIQDIFNLPKNRGGAKLFQRIMNRYGIPKEDSKELKNNIDNSSSGGRNDIRYRFLITSVDEEPLQFQSIQMMLSIGNVTTIMHPNGAVSVKPIILIKETPFIIYTTFNNDIDTFTHFVLLEIPYYFSGDYYAGELTNHYKQFYDAFDEMHNLIINQKEMIQENIKITIPTEEEVKYYKSLIDEYKIN